MSDAGYSGIPLPRKFGIKPGHRVALLGAPGGFALDRCGLRLVIRREHR